jgi:hypothetical protein
MCTFLSTFRTVSLLAFLALVVQGLVPRQVGARQNLRSAFFEVYPDAIGTPLDGVSSIAEHCGVCHFQFTGGGPRNPYGLDLEEALPGFPNNPNGRRQAVESIEDVDSDGDGFTTLIEVTDLINYVNTPTFPGLTPDNVGTVAGVDPNDILGHLVPSEEGDDEPPDVTVLSPDGGENLQGGGTWTVGWLATDNVGVTGVDIFYRDGEAAHWEMIARSEANSGAFTWHVHNTPTEAARVRIVARDAASNEGTDESSGVFTILQQPGGIVPTTLRDFHQPGTQPFGGGPFQEHGACADCHGGYDPGIEPLHNFRGSMMAQAARDPLFYACVAIAEQDAPSSGDLCLRCHTPMGWLLGRSNPTDGSMLTAFDRDGVSCDFCHRVVDPLYEPGVSPPEDEEVLAGLEPGDLPSGHSNGQYVADPQMRRRGPFGDPVSPHPWLESPVHTSSDFCGTCHDVSNPVFHRVTGADYIPGPLDQPADSVDSTILLPLERTYSEWLNSAFPDGIYDPDFAGNKPDGIVSSCQDCHMRDVEGAGATNPQAPVRPDLPLHDMTGGSSWMAGIVEQAYPGEVDPVALADGAARAVRLLELAALLDGEVVPEADSFRAEITVTNRGGHKLPTGYPEGRRMWVHVEALDVDWNTVYESGAYDPATGVLHHDDDVVVYEAKMGISPGLASALGLTAGESFHFTLNDTIVKDNRIPPRGFTNDAFATFGGAPVDPNLPGPGLRYEDGQYWDNPSYALPSATRRVVVTLLYQTTSKEYVEFLRDENSSNDAGQIMYDLWGANGRAAPVVMAVDTLDVSMSGIGNDEMRPVWALDLGANPFRAELEIRLQLSRPTRVDLQVFDLQGRSLRTIYEGDLPPGQQVLRWDGRTNDGHTLVPGVYWVRLASGGHSLARRVVHVR